jgi:hypothetical protein
VVPQGHGIDFFLGDEQEDSMSPFVKDFCHSQSGKEMAPGAAAGNDELFGNCHAS